jgi:hypothetical protein
MEHLREYNEITNLVKYGQSGVVEAFEYLENNNKVFNNFYNSHLDKKIINSIIESKNYEDFNIAERPDVYKRLLEYKNLLKLGLIDVTTDRQRKNGTIMFRNALDIKYTIYYHGGITKSTKFNNRTIDRNGVPMNTVENARICFNKVRFYYQRDIINGIISLAYVSPNNAKKYRKFASLSFKEFIEKIKDILLHDEQVKDSFINSLGFVAKYAFIPYVIKLDDNFAVQYNKNVILEFCEDFDLLDLFPFNFSRTINNAKTIDELNATIKDAFINLLNPSNNSNNVSFENTLQAYFNLMIKQPRNREYYKFILKDLFSKPYMRNIYNTILKILAYSGSYYDTKPLRLIIYYIDRINVDFNYKYKIVNYVKNQNICKAFKLVSDVIVNSSYLDSYINNLMLLKLDDDVINNCLNSKIKILMHLF